MLCFCPASDLSRVVSLSFSGFATTSCMTVIGSHFLFGYRFGLSLCFDASCLSFFPLGWPLSVEWPVFVWFFYFSLLVTCPAVLLHWYLAGLPRLVWPLSALTYGLAVVSDRPCVVMLLVLEILYWIPILARQLLPLCLRLTVWCCWTSVFFLSCLGGDGVVAVEFRLRSVLPVRISVLRLCCRR